jgi:PAS domain-containing protein
MDVTEQEQLTEELRRSEHYLAEGERLAHTGSWAFDPAGFFNYWSPELFRFTALTPLVKRPRSRRIWIASSRRIASSWLT